MKPIYTEIESPSGQKLIRAEYEGGLVHIISTDPANSDYLEYLAQLEKEEN